MSAVDQGREVPTRGKVTVQANVVSRPSPERSKALDDWFDRVAIRLLAARPGIDEADSAS